MDHAPFYEILPERFPTEEQRLEFMYSYEREAHPMASEEQLKERAKKMIAVKSIKLILSTLFCILLFKLFKKIILGDYSVCTSFTFALGSLGTFTDGSFSSWIQLFGIFSI